MTEKLRPRLLGLFVIGPTDYRLISPVLFARLDSVVVDHGESIYIGGEMPIAVGERPDEVTMNTNAAYEVSQLQWRRK